MRNFSIANVLPSRPTQTAEEDRPAEGEQDPDGRRHHDRQCEQEQHRRDEAVGGVLDRDRMPLIGPASGDQREAADVLDREPARHRLVEARHERNLEAQLLAALDQAEQHLVRRAREQ